MRKEGDDKRESHNHKHSRHHSRSHHHTRTHHHKSYHHSKTSKHHKQAPPTADTPRSPPPVYDEQNHHHYHHRRRTSRRRTSRRRNNDPESGRHPSSSVGPGRIETVLAIILAVLGLSAIALIVVGIWLLASRTGWPSGLNNTGSIAWTRLISYATACIIVGALLVPIIWLAAWAAVTQRGSRARKLRLAVIFFSSLAALILLLMTVTGFLFATTGPSFINTLLADSWTNSVKDAANKNFRICDIQNRFNCQGWLDNSCFECQPTTDGIYSNQAGTCSVAQRDICPQCWTNIPSRVLLPGRIGRLHSVSSNSTRTIGSPSAGNGKQRRSSGRRQTRSLDKNGRLRQQQEKKTPVPGCRRHIVWRNREFFIPMSVYTIFLIMVLVLLSWKTCIDSSGR